MPETPELQSVVDAAEQAAAAGDYASAEQLLREAAALQEASLGPLHADLANTLNNLGIVSEIMKKPADAERFFRRACEIATAVLEPDHPFVQTSRKNLEDFCKAQGKPIKPPIPPRAVAADRKATPTKSVGAPPRQKRADDARERLSASPPRPVEPGGFPRPLVIGVLVAGALVAAFIATPLFRSKDTVDPPSASASAPAPAAPATTPTPRGNAVATSPSNPAAAGKRRSSRLSPIVVVSAQLCKGLSTRGDWECVPPKLPVGPGALYFYTRLKSPVETTVQHRWFRGDRLHQVVELRVRANPTGGYRTYSRNTINDPGPAEWRVELRTIDGIVLHEERFPVR